MDGKIEELMECTLDRMRGIMDINSVVGDPIKAGMTTIIPISKVGFGFVTGGGEYNESLPKMKDDELPYAGGSGGGVSIKPLGFLVIDGEKSRYMSIDEEENDTWKDIIKAGVSLLGK